MRSIIDSNIENLELDNDIEGGLKKHAGYGNTGPRPTKPNYSRKLNIVERLQSATVLESTFLSQQTTQWELGGAEVQRP